VRLLGPGLAGDFAFGVVVMHQFDLSGDAIKDAEAETRRAMSEQ
jgi:hypothetical protein